MSSEIEAVRVHETGGPEVLRLESNASGKPEPIDPPVLARKGSLFLTRPTLFHYVATRDELLESADAVFDLVARGVIDATPRHRYALADARACHEDLEARRTSGSMVLTP